MVIFDDSFDVVRYDDQASPDRRDRGGRDPGRNVSAMMNCERGCVDRASTFHNTRTAGMVTRSVSLESHRALDRRIWGDRAILDRMKNMGCHFLSALPQ